MRRIRKIGTVLLVALGIVCLATCTRKTDDDKIRAVINVVQKAAEDRDVKEVLSHVDKNYRDPEGNDVQTVKNMLLFYFFRHQKIAVMITNLETTVEGASATARFQAILSGRTGASGDILPEALGAYRFDVSFKKDQDDWKIISCRWERWGESVPDGPAGR